MKHTREKIEKRPRNFIVLCFDQNSPTGEGNYNYCSQAGEHLHGLTWLTSGGHVIAFLIKDTIDSSRKNWHKKRSLKKSSSFCYFSDLFRPLLEIFWKYLHKKRSLKKSASLCYFSDFLRPLLVWPLTIIVELPFSVGWCSGYVGATF